MFVQDILCVIWNRRHGIPAKMSYPHIVLNRRIEHIYELGKIIMRIYCRVYIRSDRWKAIGNPTNCHRQLVAGWVYSTKTFSQKS